MKSVAEVRANYLIRVVTEIRDALARGEDHPWARRVTHGLLGFVGTKQKERLAAMTFVDAALGAAALRRATILLTEQGAETPLVARQAANLEASGQRVLAGEAKLDDLDKIENHALRLWAEWGAAGKFPSKVADHATCVAFARAQFELVVPELSPCVTHFAWLDAIRAFERTAERPSGAHLEDGEEAKWETLARVIRKAFDPGCKADRLERVWRRWRAGKSLSEDDDDLDVEPGAPNPLP